MTNEVPKYTWLKAVYNQCELSYWKVRNSKAVQGKRQRAMLHGQREVWHDVRIGGVLVTYIFLLKMKRWHAILHLDDYDHSLVISQTVKDHQVFLVLRRHAVERYVQRQVWHDMSHELTDEEYDEYSRRIISHLNVVSMCYDRGSEGFMIGCDGGSFIATAHGDDYIKIILVQTFVTVSMMKENQRVSNGVSNRRTLEFRRENPEESKYAI